MEDLPGLQAWEEQFTSLLNGAAITKFTFFNVNPNYFAFDPDKIWVLDGGVQIDLENGSSVSYCWNNEMELMDMIIGPAEELMAELDYYELEDISNRINNVLANKAIKAIEFEWNWYQKMNDDFELEEELNYAPLGFLIRFDQGDTLQLGSIQFAINATDKSLAKVNYLPEGDLLVALNEVIAIEIPDDEMQ